MLKETQQNDDGLREWLGRQIANPFILENIARFLVGKEPMTRQRKIFEFLPKNWLFEATKGESDTMFYAGSDSFLHLLAGVRLAELRQDELREWLSEHNQTIGKVIINENQGWEECQRALRELVTTANRYINSTALVFAQIEGRVGFASDMNTQKEFALVLSGIALYRPSADDPEWLTAQPLFGGAHRMHGQDSHFSTHNIGYISDRIEHRMTNWAFNYVAATKYQPGPNGF